MRKHVQPRYGSFDDTKRDENPESYHLDILQTPEDTRIETFRFLNLYELSITRSVSKSFKEAVDTHLNTDLRLKHMSCLINEGKLMRNEIEQTLQNTRMRIAHKNSPISWHKPLQCASGFLHILLLITLTCNGCVALPNTQEPTATFGEFIYPFVNIGVWWLMVIKLWEIEEVENDFMSLLNYFSPLIIMLLGTNTFHTLPSSVLILNALLIPILLPIKYVEKYNADFEQEPKLVTKLDTFTHHLKKVCLHLEKQSTQELKRLADDSPSNQRFFIQRVRPDTEAPRARPRP